jgi:DNA helicase-2/ATP-dependent DNA helicase PcrA
MQESDHVPQPFSIHPAQTTADTEKYAAFVRSHFEARGLSATALNAYLACPWKWFYRHFFRMQFVYTVSQMKGNAVHGALQNFFDQKNTDPNSGLAFLLERLDHHLSKQALTAREKERVRLDARNALTGYFETYRASTSWALPTVNEFFIKGALLEGVRLTGKLDKLEILPDGAQVNVIDYKTGKPKSRNHIEGKTKAQGAGDYKRQLVFYRILLERMHDPRYVMKEAVIDFVEPTEAGTYKREAFVIDTEEVRELEKEIARVADEITTMSFWDKRCDDKTCQECGLRDLLG